MAEYINDADRYWDEQHSGLNENGKRISHQEQYEFMIGYPDDSPQMTESESDLETMLLASMAASISSLVATTNI